MKYSFPPLSLFLTCSFPLSLPLSFPLPPSLPPSLLPSLPFLLPPFLLTSLFLFPSYTSKGKLKYNEVVFEGFDKAFDAFSALFKGTNIGKVVVKL